MLCALENLANIGWESANSRIYLRKETLADWRSTDDDVAVFLLHHNKVFNDFVVPAKSSSSR